jgi:RNA-directed DNA polymerase
MGIEKGRMKRAGNLIESIAEADNLRLAYFKACRGKRDKPEILRFRDNLNVKLSHLRTELLRGEVDWGGYHAFQICDPKARTIHAAPFRTRVAHHAIMNVCEPFFESFQIFDSYACRKGRGLDLALERASRFSRSSAWYGKMDIRKYFDSIDHSVLREMLEKRFKDPIVLNLFCSILDTYHASPGKGVPIGNLTSQYFANHYLAFLDHHVKDTLRWRYYVRYMDDFVLWSDSKVNLLAALKKVESYLHHILKLELRPFCLNACNKGMTFLGYRVFPNGARLARRSRDRFRNKADHYHGLFMAGVWDEETLSRHMEPLLAFIRRGASRSFRERILNKHGLCSEARTA